MMRLDATLKRHGITREQLVDVAILCGTDFNEGISGVGPKTAVAEITEHGDLWSVLDDRGAYINGADRVRELFLDPPVTDEYEVETDISPDIDAARAYVTGEWEVDADEIDRGFDRIESAAVQTGLDDWT